MSAVDLEKDQLLAALRAAAAGLYSEEAAVELLIAHGFWLRRRDFLAYVDYNDEPEIVGGTPVAAIQWKRVVSAIQRNRFRASSGELKLLQAAASVRGYGSWPFGDLISSLDATTVGLVLQAIAHAAGWHERHHILRVDGHQGIASTLDPITIPAELESRFKAARAARSKTTGTDEAKAAGR